MESEVSNYIAIAFQLVECTRKGDVNKCRAILETNNWKANDVKDETGFKYLRRKKN